MIVKELDLFISQVVILASNMVPQLSFHLFLFKVRKTDLVLIEILLLFLELNELISNTLENLLQKHSVISIAHFALDSIQSHFIGKH